MILLVLAACPGTADRPADQSPVVDSGDSQPSESADTGAPSDTGTGPTWPTRLADADHVFVGESRDDVGFNAPDWFGWRVDGVGDVDGDGLPDMLMTGRYDDEGAPDAGKVYLVTASDLTGASIPIETTGSAWYGAGEDDHAGRDISSAGDLDGDGRADLLVSSYSSAIAYQAGAVYVIGSGSVTPGSHPLADADVIIHGQTAEEYVGRSIDGGGDLDGDAQDDLLIGAMGWKDQRGRVCQISGFGLSSGALDAVSSACTRGDEDLAQLGMDVGIAGDVDGDGRNDVLMGSWTYNGDGTNRGRAYLSLGGVQGGLAGDADHVFDGTSDWMSIGRAVAPAGDVNGDGHADVLIGGHGTFKTDDSNGHTYLFFGGDIAPGVQPITNADLTFDGETADDYSGDALASAGDVDGDGLDDLVMGALFTGIEGGTAYLWHADRLEDQGVYSLRDAHRRFESAGDEDRAGASVAGPGDVDGDGLADLLIGAYGVDGSRGAAYLILAP